MALPFNLPLAGQSPTAQSSAGFRYPLGNSNSFNLVSTNPNVNPYAGNIVMPQPTQGVQGASTNNSPTGNQGAWQAAGHPGTAPVGYGGESGTGGGGSNAPQAPSIDFDALIAPAIQGYNDYINTLQSQVEPGAQQLKWQETTAKQEAQNSINAQTGTLNTESQRQQTQEGNAVEEAKRMYAEMSQGLQSRYGGTTGTGAFLNEQLGQQTGRNIAFLHQGLSQNLADIASRLQQVQEVGRTALQGIDQHYTQAITDLRNSFNDRIGQIRMTIGQTQAQKAQMAANVMQNYQQQVNAYNSQNEAFKQNLVLQQQQAENTLRLYQGQLSGYAQKLPTVPTLPAATQMNTVSQPQALASNQGITQAAAGKRYNPITG